MNSEPRLDRMGERLVQYAPGPKYRDISGPVKELIERTIKYEPGIGRSPASLCLPGWIDTFGQAFLKDGGYALTPNAVRALLHTLVAARQREEYLGGEPQPMETAPKTEMDYRTKEFLGWCPDENSPNGGDWRVCWWEPHMGVWYGDRDDEEHPVAWLPYPAPLPEDWLTIHGDPRAPKPAGTIIGRKA